MWALVGCVPITRPESPAESSAPNFDIAEYGQPVAFRPTRAIRFPDFTLTYVGRREVLSENPPGAFILHDFRAVHDNETVHIVWSSGVGDIAPTAFAIGGQDYLLELVHSEEFGKLEENQLVIWRQSTPPAPTATPTATVTPTTPANADLPVTLNQPFELRRRERAFLDGNALTVELRRVLSDSRCPVNELGVRVTCAWIGEGLVELTVRSGEGPRQRVVLGTANRAAPKAVAVEDYLVQLLNLSPLPTVDQPLPAQNEYSALLQITRRGDQLTATPVAVATPQATPTPHYGVQVVIQCDRLTDEDAEAVLGEPVSRDSLLINFFCLQASAARVDTPAPADFPIYLGDFSHRNVVAATQWGVDDTPDPLLELAGRVRRVNPTGDENAYLKLQTFQAVGLLADAFAQLPQMAVETQGLHVETLDGVGEAALWLWQDLPDERHFAALLSLDAGKYVIGYALVRAEQTEETVRDAMMAVIHRMSGR